MPLQTSTNKLPPLGARFEDGFYLGPNSGSAETLVLTKTGVVRCRTIRRKPPKERWTNALLQNTGASELQPNLTDGSQTRIGIRAPVVVTPVVGEPEAFAPCPEPKTRKPRRQPLQRSDFLSHGYTLGCPGCDLIQSGRQGEARHSETCKRRMEEILLSSDTERNRVLRARERANEYYTQLHDQEEQTSKS